MRSIDANIAIRWLTWDDPVQAPLAEKVLCGPVFLTLTVLIEVAWVLRRSYRFDRAMLDQAVRTLVGLATVTVEASSGVAWALDRHAAGADLSDMLHLIASRGTEAFVSFERHLARDAGPDAPLPIETPA